MLWCARPSSLPSSAAGRKMLCPSVSVDIRIPDPERPTWSTRARSCPGSSEPLAFVDVGEPAAGSGTAAAVRRPAERLRFSEITFRFTS